MKNNSYNSNTNMNINHINNDSKNIEQNCDRGMGALRQMQLGIREGGVRVKRLLCMGLLKKGAGRTFQYQEGRLQ